ncbi:MAG: hypothetical protein HY757_03160 [Nitrospirae bacterium]|nr:hypothetical protein [Nitrospirota bacterium]
MKTKILVVMAVFLIPLFVGSVIAKEEKSESGINIGGELKFRYRHNLDEKGGSPGFQFYEAEMFMDSAIHDNASAFVEYNLIHSKAPEPENVWIDFHKSGELAATEGTGLMIGHFQPLFGYLNNDDNESYIYGGRTTVNVPLIREKTIDSQSIRGRQIGIAGSLKFGPVLIQPQVYNGNGSWVNYGGSDNDYQRMDFVGRIQSDLPNELGIVGLGYWNAPKTKGATSNSGGTQYGSGGAKHVRDIVRYAAYFKYPNVSQATQPDLSLGGKPFVVYSEYMLGTHKGNPDVTAYKSDQDFVGGYIEANVNILRDKLVGILRYDYFDPNTAANSDSDHVTGITLGAHYNFWKANFLKAEYEVYDGGKSASGIDDDRIALEIGSMF